MTAPVTIENVLVVGMHFRGADVRALVPTIPIGTVLRLEREPDNAYDPQAIKVFYEDTFIGYIERDKAFWLSSYIDEGRTPTATIIEFVPGQRNNIHPSLTVVV